MQFNKHQQELIREYKKLLVYGYKKISSIGLNFKTTRARKRVLYFMMGAMQSYSESLLKLMGSIPIYERSGESLLRSQIELLFNLRFIYSDRSESKARLFLSDLLLESVSFAKKHHKFWDKYPNWNLTFGVIKKPCDWDKFILTSLYSLYKDSQKYKDKFVKKMPSLYDRTLIIDKYLKKIGKFSENNSAEKYYIYYHQYLSQATHLNISGLLRSLRNKKDIFKDPFFDIDSKPEDAERILSVSYQVYLTMLRTFLQIFNSYDSMEFKDFLNYSKKMVK